MPNKIEPKKLSELLERTKPMTPLERELQKVSFVWGNLPSSDKRSKLDIACSFYKDGELSKEALQVLEDEYQYRLRLAGTEYWDGSD